MAMGEPAELNVWPCGCVTEDGQRYLCEQHRDIMAKVGPSPIEQARARHPSGQPRVVPPKPRRVWPPRKRRRLPRWRKR